MSIDMVRKSSIIYRRLAEAYTEGSQAELAEIYFDISRQALNGRRGRKFTNKQRREIMAIFDDVNLNWLDSEKEHELKHMPVRDFDKPRLLPEKTKEVTADYDALNDLISADNDLDHLIESIRDSHESFVKDLESFLEKNQRYLSFLNILLRNKDDS